MSNIIYFRSSLAEENELQIAKKYFKCVDNRTKVEKGDFVICRYSAVPFYKELEEDITNLGGRLINSYKQHRYVADLRNWYEDLKDITPETWFRLEDIPEDGPFVLKGETNSKKFLFDTHMFAKNKREAVDVYCRLQDDNMISEQSIYIRRFVPLKNYLIGLRGLPVSKEFRIFVCNKKIITIGYYWSNYWDDLEEKPEFDAPDEFINKIINTIGNKCNFYVVDVAQMVDGNWTVIELNDGQQSGLSMNEPEILYCNLAAVVNNSQL